MSQEWEDLKFGLGIRTIWGKLYYLFFSLCILLTSISFFYIRDHTLQMLTGTIGFICLMIAYACALHEIPRLDDFSDPELFRIMGEDD